MGIEPHQVKWHLMHASCLRKIGSFHQALDKYRETHEQFPESKEVLQYLVRLCSDMNMDKELKDYTTKLRRLEKMLKEREERAQRHPSATTNARRTRDRAKRAESNNRLGSGRLNSAKSGRELSAKSRGSSKSGSGGNSGPNSLHRENSAINHQIDEA